MLISFLRNNKGRLVNFALIEKTCKQDFKHLVSSVASIGSQRIAKCRRMTGVWRVPFPLIL